MKINVSFAKDISSDSLLEENDLTTDIEDLTINIFNMSNFSEKYKYSIFSGPKFNINDNFIRLFNFLNERLPNLKRLSLKNEDDSYPYRLPAFNKFANFSNLQFLYIKNINFQKNSQYLENLSQQLTSLTLDYTHIYNLDFMKNFEKLENLTIKKESELYMRIYFLLNDENNKVEFSSNLKNITIMDCNDMSSKFEHQLKEKYPEINFIFINCCNEWLEALGWLKFIK